MTYNTLQLLISAVIGY